MKTRVDFTRPPVVEVAVAVQFDALTRLTTPHLGLFWGLVAESFPQVREYVPRPPLSEAFPRQHQVESLLVRVTGTAPVSRCWFISEDDTRLIQIQSDRFVFNWRKRSATGTYPRYEFVREQFDRYLGMFRRFLSEHALGEIEPNQCELSYVNAIDVGVTELSRVTPLWRGEHSDSFLPLPGSARLSASYEMLGEDQRPQGHLHLSVRAEPEAGQPLLTLTARGRPDPQSLEGVAAFFELGHAWIVHGFVTVTTPEMHQRWGRTT